MINNRTTEKLIAHEMGHAFQDYWCRKKPLRGYRSFFKYQKRFEDPWNELADYRRNHPDLILDDNKWISWYAWFDSEEDFADTFAVVVMKRGNISSFRSRPGVYKKMKCILDAGQKIIRSDFVLKDCNDLGYDYLFGGHKVFKCPILGVTYGIPNIADSYICPCGREVYIDGTKVTHHKD